jgi:ribosomal protein L3 glutamine methyltransferase
VIVPRSFIAELLEGRPVALGAGPEAISDVLDMCTGSGCLAIMAADAFPNARVDAADTSADALQVARRNVADYQLEQRVTPVKSDLFAALGTKRYDIIVCNPPVRDRQRDGEAAAEYTHEPKLALAGGADGMNLVKTLVRQARGHLKRGGLLIVEVGDGRAAAEKIFSDLPLTWLTTSAATTWCSWSARKNCHERDAARVRDRVAAAVHRHRRSGALPSERPRVRAQMRARGSWASLATRRCD